MNKPEQKPVPLAVSAVQELAERNELLERENTRLKNRLRSVGAAKTRLRRKLAQS